MQIIRDESCFFEASIILARHLYSKSALNASAGLLGVVRLVNPRTGDIKVALLKIQVKNEKFVKLRSTTLTQMTVEDVENLLLEKIQKGAIYPHPERQGYDLKVIDNQTSDETARYFTDGFLGCKSKQSDEHQVKRLLPEIEQFAKQSKIAIPNEKIPKLIVDLRKQKSDISTSLIGRLLVEEGIFEKDNQREEFIDFVESSDLGIIDIPKRSFDTRGTGERDIPRELEYEFKDPKYRGVKIIGPAEILEQLIKGEGDTITFTINTTSNGFRVNYG